MGMSSFERGLIGLVTLAVIVAVALWIGRGVGKPAVRYRRVLAATVAATFVLVVLGAFVRLSDAGLGCPDWPGCYGNLSPHHASEQILCAEAAQPGGPVSLHKAWKEMIHRYLAMSVGAVIAGLMIAAWRNRKDWRQSPLLATVIAATVIFQAALGAWTVTMLLRPAIVTSHLLGGIATLSLLAWQWSRQPGAGLGLVAGAGGIMSSKGLRVFGLVALLVLFTQIVLGGWVSTNYAALACSDLPTCNGVWLPEMSFGSAFHVLRPLGYGPDGELLTLEALRAIHWTHRVGALLTLLVVGGFALRLLRVAKPAAMLLMALLALQLLLGVSNVLFGLPLPVAVAHNGVAALLFVSLLLINARMYRNPQ